MDITEYVKRNNFAVAQYEVELRCTAQNRLFSDDMNWPPPAKPSTHRSRATLRIAVTLSVSRIIANPSRRNGAYSRKSRDMAREGGAPASRMRLGRRAGIDRCDGLPHAERYYLHYDR